MTLENNIIQFKKPQRAQQQFPLEELSKTHRKILNPVHVYLNEFTQDILDFGELFKINPLETSDFTYFQDFREAQLRDTISLYREILAQKRFRYYNEFSSIFQKDLSIESPNSSLIEYDYSYEQDPLNLLDKEYSDPLTQGRHPSYFITQALKLYTGVLYGIVTRSIKEQQDEELLLQMFLPLEDVRQRALSHENQREISLFKDFSDFETNKKHFKKSLDDLFE